MEVYAFALSGSSHAINAHTVEIYSEVLNLGKRIATAYLNLYHKTGKDRWNDNQDVSKFVTFERFVKGYRSFRIYIAEVDSGAHWKKLSGSKAWDLLVQCEGFKPEMTKLLLRA